MQRDPIQRTAELAAEGRAFVVITVVRSDGSAPRKAGAKLVLWISPALLRPLVIGMLLVAASAAKASL